MLDHYVERILQDYREGRDLKVAWDAGNGAAGEAMVQVAAQLPGEHILLNEKVDGNFPAHHPDPTVVENLQQLRDTVLTRAAISESPSTATGTASASSTARVKPVG